MIGAIIACVASLLVGLALGWVGSAMHFENLRRKRNTEAWVAGTQAGDLRRLSPQQVRDLVHAYLLEMAPAPIPFHPEPGTPEAEMLEEIQSKLDKNVDHWIRRNESMKQDIEQWLADNPEEPER